MKNFTLGLVLGLAISICTAAYAASRADLEKQKFTTDDDGNVVIRLMLS